MNKFIALSIFLLLFISTISHSQDASQYIQTLIDKTQSVKGKKIEYEQKLSKSETLPYEVSVLITTMGKGDVSLQTVDARDLNPSRIIFEPKGDMVHVTAQVKGGKKLVKVVSNGELSNYDDEFLFYASDIEQGRALADALKGLTVLAEKEQAGASTTALNKSDLSGQIISNVKEVVINGSSYQQALQFDTKNANIFQYSIDDISKGIKEQYSVNAADLNPFKIDFDTRRNEVFVQFITKADAKLIAYNKNGEISNYAHQFEIKMNSVEDARVSAILFQQFVKIAETEEIKDYSGLTSPECTSFLKESIGQVVINQDGYEQAFSIDPKNEWVLIFNHKDVSKGVSQKFVVNAADLKNGKTSFDTKGNEVLIEVSTADNQKLIRNWENDVEANYNNKFSIRASDIENARAISEVITRFIELAKNDMRNKVAFSSVEEAEKYMVATVGQIVINTNTYEQKIEKKPDNTCLYSYQFTDVTKNTQYDYEFNFQDIDINKIQFDTKGNQAIVMMEIKGKNKLIKTYKDGEVDKYTYSLEMLLKDIEEARYLVSALRTKAEACLK